MLFESASLRTSWFRAIVAEYQTKYSRLLLFQPTVGWNPTADQKMKSLRTTYKTWTITRRFVPPIDVPVVAR